jgi:hypothetical protein
VKVADKVTFCFDLVATRNLTPGIRAAVAASNGRTVPGCVDNSENDARRPM